MAGLISVYYNANQASEMESASYTVSQENYVSTGDESVTPATEAPSVNLPGGISVPLPVFTLAIGLLVLYIGLKSLKII